MQGLSRICCALSGEHSSLIKQLQRLDVGRRLVTYTGTDIFENMHMLVRQLIELFLQILTDAILAFVRPILSMKGHSANVTGKHSIHPRIASISP